MEFINKSYPEVEKIKISYGRKNIDIIVTFQNRKRLKITVYPDKTVTVNAPLGKSIEEVKKHLKKRADWIMRQIDYFDQFHPLPTERRFVSGETHCYLGRQYRLKIKKAKQSNVKLIGRFFYVRLTDTEDKEIVKEKMLEWYKLHAKKLLGQRVDNYLTRFQKMDLVYNKIIFRRMRKRWGSCSVNKVLVFNTELVKAPLHCIDYVIVHELCHLLYPKHNKDFYKLLSKMLPDWKSRKLRLEKVIL